MNRVLLRAMRAAAPMLVLACGCAEPPSPDMAPADSTAVRSMPAVPESSFVGAWRAERPAADGPGRALALELHGSGAATLTSDTRNGKPPVVESGLWQMTADGHVLVMLGVVNGAAMNADTLVFRLRDSLLVAVSQDTLAWGHDGLALAKVPASR